MSTELVVLNNNALAMGGVGIDLDSKLFALKPGTLTVVQPTSTQEGAIPGKFRVVSTGDHYDEMKLVLLLTPVERREYYLKGKLSADSKLCFSLDNKQPHPKAKEPQSPTCASCSKGSWAKWRETKSQDDLPQCRTYYHCVVADRETQMVYNFDIKGKNVSPFKVGMENVVRTLALIKANVIADNKKIAAGDPEVAAAVAAGQWHAKLTPMPNLFDVMFPVTLVKDGQHFVVKVGKPMQLNADGKKDFGNVYLEYVRHRQQGTLLQEEAEVAATEEAAVASAVTEAPARTEVDAVIGPVVGEVVGKEEITI